ALKYSEIDMTTRFYLPLFGWILTTMMPLPLPAVEASSSVPSPSTRPYGLVIHGGAGVILRKEMSAEMEAEYRAKLTEARDAGYAVLERGGPALDAIVTVISILEDSPLFNAGK